MRMLYISVKEAAESDGPDFQPEDVYFETPEEALERSVKTLATYVKLNRKTKIHPADYKAMSE